MGNNQDQELQEDLQKIAHGFKSAFLDELYESLPLYGSTKEFFRKFHVDDYKED